MEPGSGSASASVFGRVYRVASPAEVATIDWPAAPPRVGVYLQSRLGLGDDAVELDTTIRYEVAGGPVNVVNLRLPTAWAAHAGVHLVGESFTKTDEVRGEWTRWTIRPERPIWGTVRLRVRSRRDAEPGRSFAFPDVIPLGDGAVEKVLSVERRTGAAIEVEGSAGLQAIDPSRLVDEWPAPSAGAPVGVYRVTNDRWSLTVRPGERPTHAPPDGQVAIRAAETRCAVGSDGVVFGATTFLVDARLGRALKFHLPPAARVLSAVAGARALPVLSPEAGAWSVPFDASGLVEVDLLWTDTSTGEIVLPRPEQTGVPTLVRIASPGRPITSPGAGGFEAISGAGWRVERVGRLARRVLGLVADFDRSSAAEESELEAMLDRFALESQLAERAVRASRDEPLRRALDDARRSLSEGLELYGLDDFRAHLQPGARVVGVPPAAAAPLPLPLGQAAYFRSTSTSSGRDQSIPWELAAPTPPARPTDFSWPALALILAVLLPRVLGVPVFRARSLGIVAALALTALAPFPGLILLLAAWVGL